MSKQDKSCEKAVKKISRRNFIKGTMAAGGMVALEPLITGTVLPPIEKLWLNDPHGVGDDFEDYGAEDVIYTTCEQCNTHCTLKAVIAPASGDGPYTSIIRKLAGNPYSPLNMVPFGAIPYDTPVKEAAKGQGEVARVGRAFRGGRICLKGQAGIQTAYDALRVTKPLKRVGPRGSGKWQTISWEQAIDEIVNGAPDLGTPGLKDIWAFVPEKPVMADWEKVQKGEMSQEEFDKKYRDVLIDTRHPDLGPKANQVVSLFGDRRDFFQKRFWKQTMGSINTIHHGGICGVSGVMGNIRSFNSPKPKKRMYADIDNAEFLIVWGTNPLVANKGPTWLAPKITNALKRGMKLAVVDPRMSKIAEKAHLWVPIYPGTDGALALAMARWIIENNRYDRRYLTNPNRQAAAEDGEPTWSDATHLVNLSDPKRPKLRASDLGIGNKDQLVVLENGRPVPHDKAKEGQLEVDTEINGIRVKSVFTLFKERVMEYTLEEYARICRIEVEQIVELAREFTSHGKKAAIISYRGPAMHVNGFYNLRAINCLNHLIGNYDWKGGSITTGAKFKLFNGRYDVLKVPNGFKAWGIPLDRTKKAYEKTSLFKRDGYPAKRPWFQFSANLTQEVLPSAADGYPYPIKALFIHRISPVVSAPLGQEQVEILKNTNIIPLIVASDVVIGETSMYADYILPDCTYLERWGLEVIYPNFELKESHIQQPVTRVYPEVRQAEDVLIDIAKKMGLPGVGDNAFPDGSPLNRAEDFYLKVVANIAYDGKEPVPDADDEELAIFEKARRKALGKFFDLEAWKRAVKPEEWRKVVYVLNRGGRFEARGNEYDGPYLKYKLASEVNFYNEKLAGAKNSYDGKFFDGLPKVAEVTFYNGKKVDDPYPLVLINWKSAYTGTHRNISDVWLREIEAENLLWINPEDARQRGIKSGAKVKIRSANSEVTATALVTARIRPGVVGAAFSYGHFAYGSRPVEIDGVKQAYATPYGHTSGMAGTPGTGYALGRGTGFPVNYLLRRDEALSYGAQSDPVGGGAAQLDTRVEVLKA
ncbi:molybdopterin-dependent oxidoreductase [Calderihabitans maritimus]|uniref:Molybdopterin oxidoreductase, molybdopterin-binding subunit n=1 Tax=Calderihabitans maritimus TaxID=1246530 RepID=A0A1Z5HR60_9FIRM|nr:molybdopterin-dependent oxidoreductase [Calderihabitans maritimus]GAW92016.1 molybdopterin oxidoreductase, molybdopterin-binding subunit [Calderihabitans maritimus]